jgi:LuxR family maltose regulon positive regulatory protein
LNHLDQSNLFLIPLDNERRWYRYHHLFADLLRQRLQQNLASSGKQDEINVADLHRRASQWYEESGLAVEAFRHAASAEDIERAARLIEGDGVPLHFQGATAPVLSWLESLPDSILNSRPSLWVAFASVLLLTGQNNRVESKLQAAEAALEGAEMTPQHRDLIGRVASLRATMAVVQKDAAAIITQAQRALEHLHADNLSMRSAAHWTLGFAHQLQGDRAAASSAYSEVIAVSAHAGNSLYTLAATITLGQLQESDNKLTIAAKTYDRALQLAGEPPHPMACEAYLGLARLHYQWNDLESAEQYGRRCLELTHKVDSDTFASYGLFLARLNLARRNIAGAIAALDEAEAFMQQHDYMYRIPDVAAMRVLVLLRQNQLNAAQQLAETHDLDLSRARVLLVKGDPAAALALLESRCHEAQAKKWADEQLQLMVLQSMAHYAQNQKDTAVQLLRDALALAKPGGFMRLFVDEGSQMAQLLYDALAAGIETGYIRRLLAAFPPAGSVPVATSLAAETKSQEMVEPLSEREIEVLYLIAEGLTNQQVADRLYLSLHTVKAHARNIYGKLGVSNRTEAVARGRTFGLISHS